MAVALSPDARKQALRSLARFAEEQLELELDDLQAMALLDFMLKEIAPSAYNAGVADAQGTCETGWRTWKAPAPGRSSPTGPRGVRSDGSRCAGQWQIPAAP